MSCKARFNNANDIFALVLNSFPNARPPNCRVCFFGNYTQSGLCWNNEFGNYILPARAQRSAQFWAAAGCS